VSTRAGDERAPAGVERRLGRTGRDPVLETVRRNRRFRAFADEEETGNAPVAETGQALRIARPPHQLYVHERNVKLHCFVAITP
jgi:hypothetical protein